MDTHDQDPIGVAATAPTAAPRRKRLNLHGWHALLAGMALGLLGGLGGLWWWSGSEGSLATALRWTAAALPTGQQLHTEGVQGSLRQGGHIGRLQWQRDALRVDVQQARLDIVLRRLLLGQLPIQTLQIERLQVQDHRSETAPGPLGPWHWPLQVDLDWRIGSLQWQSDTPTEVQDMQGRYGFDGQYHRLQLHSLQWANGHYQGQLQLQAQGPMQLELMLQGQVQPPTPARAPRPWPALQAQLQLQGPLTGPQARLALQAQLGQRDGPAPRLQVQGELQPQATQPLVSLHAQLQRLDLALLWPSAPRTDIDGQIHITPQGPGWRLQTELDNRLTGSWDRHRIPLQHLQARLDHDGQGWLLQQAHARWQGGQLQGQGRWQDSRTGDTGRSEWHSTWQVQGLRAEQWWSDLQGPALSGQIMARRSGRGPLQLEARLQAPGHGASDALFAQARLDATGWSLDQLDVQWLDMRVQTRGRWQAQTQRLEATTHWQLPGLRGQIEGFIAPHQGQGQWQAEGQDPTRLQAWLRRWPVRPQWSQWLINNPLPANVQASGQWQGGWARDGLELQARLQLPHWQLQTRGRLQQRSGTNAWQGQVAQFELDGQLAGTASDTTERVQLRLDGPLDWQWQGAVQNLQWQAHRWQLRGDERTATLALEPGHWQAPLGAGTRPAVRVQASASQLPLRWVRWLGLPDMPGDLVLQGGLDLDWAERSRLLAWLERSSGDLQAATELQHTPRVQAGVRTARAQLRIEGPQAMLNLDWDSSQAGQLQARLGSRLALDAPAGIAELWPADAPLSGQVRARLPRVGVWTWLAPPGWRVQGSLDASIDLVGTRGQPQWNGRVQADDLAVRSAVEGVEFRQGRLRARLQEQQMLLDEFELQGAGNQGGSITAQGQVRWVASAKRALDAVSMDLQMQARSLRVTNRADRRLSLSGQVRAQLTQGRMRLSGTLEADSAQFVLTDDNTPTLGKDVLIVQPRQVTAAAKTPQGLSVMGVPDVQVLLRLGPDFRLRGQGIDTRLAGEVQLASNEGTAGQPRLAGQVRTEGGLYRAYGQQLEIEQGLLQFTGAYDNPSLDILALRPNLGQRVGVRVSGTALAPRVRLYADPDLPDADKLAWLVLGRSPATGGTESAVLQQAALTLLGGNGKRLGGELAVALGVDDISLANRSATTAAGTTATGTAVMLGKRLSRDFYLAYESSISGAFGNLFIFYDLSRKLTLRAQAGEFNALDLVYTIRHD